MALEKQIVSVNFAQGLDTKTDEKLVLPGKLTLLENGVFTTGRKIKKRNGYNALSDQDTSGNTIGVGRGLVAYGNELIKYAGSNLYTYSESIDRWVNKGALNSINVGMSQVVRNQYSQTVPEAAFASNISVYVWKDSRGGVRASVIDKVTDAPIQSDVSLNSSADHPMAIVCGDFIYVYYVQGVNLIARKLDPANPSSFGAEVTLENNVNGTGPWYDVTTSGAKMVVVYRAAANSLTVLYVTQDLVVGSATLGLPTPVTFSTAGKPANNFIGINVDPTTYKIWVYWAYKSGAGAGQVWYTVYNQDLTVFLSPTAIDAAAKECPRLTGVKVSETQQIVFMEYFDAGATSTQHYVTVRYVTSAGAVTSPATPIIARGVGIISKGFSYGSNQYVFVVFPSTLQPSNFVIDQSGNVVAKCLWQTADGLPAENTLPDVQVDGTKIYTVSLIRTRFAMENGTFYTSTGIASLNIDLNPDDNFYTRKIGNNLLISGGFLQLYDGQSVVESGFHYYPEGYTAADVGAGLLGNGNYLYYCVYSWVDNKGQIHRSSPGVGYAITLPANRQTTVTIPTLRLTAKKSPRAGVLIEVYRTVVNGTVAYKLGTVANDTSVDSVTYSDNAADSSITSNEILYTTGGVVDNIAPPSCSIIELYKNRMVVSGLEDKLDVWYSKEKKSGEGLAFNDTFKFKVNPLGGNITALKFMDDKLIIFKENLIFVVAGDGPNDLGQQNTFNIPELVTSDVGCPYPNSLVLTPDGIMFKSNKGIYMLNRQLQVQYIGAEVEAYNSQTIMSADLLQDKNQVRFLMKEGVSLLYDYYFGQWSTFTNHEGYDADVWQGSYVYLRTDGSVYKANYDYYLDNNSQIQLRIATAWLKLSGVQNYQRVRRVALLGNYESSHILKMSVGYDYEPYYQDQILFVASDIIDTSVYGDDAVYGDSVVYGGVSDSTYQFRAHIPRQKCESIRFLFEDVTSGTPGQSYSLSDLSLEVGMKRGLMKLKSAKTL